MLKPKTILIFLALGPGSLLEKGYAANPVDVCRKGVSSVANLFPMSAKKRERLTQNIMGRLKTAFLGEEIRGFSPELAQRMDEVFYREVRKKIASLTPAQLREVERIVMRDQAVPNSGFHAIASVTGVSFSNYHPALGFNPNLPLHHPYRRIALIHELEHIIDLASGLDISRDRTSVLRAEAKAAITEYQYINMVFGLQDLEDLERNFPVLPQNLIRRVHRTFFPFPQHTSNLTLIGGPSVKEAVARYINGEFMIKVRSALEVKQDTYVETILARIYR